LSRVSEKLSSLHLTTWILLTLLLWLVWGILMAGSDTFVQGFGEMSNTLTRDWLMAPDTDFSILKTWFLGLCVLMALMGINLVFCSWTKILRIIRSRFNGPMLFMLIVHMVFGFVALGHFAGLMFGSKYHNVQLWNGKRFEFENGYDVELVRVNFVNDYSVLNKAPKDITEDEFNYKENCAEVVLRKDGKEVERGKTYKLRPMNHKSIQITLETFLPPRDGEQNPESAGEPGAVFTVSRNQSLKIFLALYPMMITGILIHLIMTWRSKYPKHSEK
jgi:hypothetical protein